MQEDGGGGVLLEETRAAPVLAWPLGQRRVAAGVEAVEPAEKRARRNRRALLPGQVFRGLADAIDIGTAILRLFSIVARLRRWFNKVLSHVS